jgi:hypothetical protein
LWSSPATRAPRTSPSPTRWWRASSGKFHFDLIWMCEEKCLFVQAVSWVKSLELRYMFHFVNRSHTSVSDPHWLYADPDPAFKTNADPGPDPDSGKFEQSFLYVN